MARYFFHVGDGRTLYRDEEGRLCRVEEAKARAAVVAAELAADGAHYKDFAVHVVDESGHEIAKVPVA